MKFGLAALIVFAALSQFGCQSTSESSSATEPTRGARPETAARIYFLWDAPKKTPKSLNIDINDKRVATAEENDVLILNAPPGEIRLKVGFAGFRSFGTPKATAKLSIRPDEKRYFLFTAKVVPNVPIVTTQGAYGFARDEFALNEVDGAEFARVAGARTH